MRKFLLWGGGAVALIVALVLGLSQASGDDPVAGDARAYSLQDARARLQGAPAPLAALHAQAARLLPGGRAAFRARLRGLRGHPVVVTKWASWCGPCRVEFPAFQQLSVEYGKRIAFLGVNSGDNRAAAERFLREFPAPFPSYEDPKIKVAQDLGPENYFPLTVFYDARGERVYQHAGVYATVADLRTDIERYALGS